MDAALLPAVGLLDEADPLERYDPLFAAPHGRNLNVCGAPDLVGIARAALPGPAPACLPGATPRATAG